MMAALAAAALLTAVGLLTLITHAAVAGAAGAYPQDAAIYRAWAAEHRNQSRDLTAYSLYFGLIRDGVAQDQHQQTRRRRPVAAALRARRRLRAHVDQRATGARP